MTHFRPVPKPEKKAKVRKPWRWRPKKTPPDELRYMRCVRQFGCAVCGSIVNVKDHHPTVGRFSQRKCSNWWVIPLCQGHHQGELGHPGPAIHHERARWEEWFGDDHDYIADTQRKVFDHFGIEVPRKYRK